MHPQDLEERLRGLLINLIATWHHTGAAGFDEVIRMTEEQVHKRRVLNRHAMSEALNTQPVAAAGQPVEATGSAGATGGT
jgi:hypothetical protein